MRVPAPFLDELAGVVGRAHVLVGDVTAGYAVDWTGRFRGSPEAVVRPADTGEVAAVVTACRAAGVAVVPQGGNTGLVGGAVPPAGSVVVSLVRLDTVGSIDVQAGQVTVGAGVTLARLQAAAAGHGLRFAVDLAARDSATIGGMVATNAGGLRVLAFGPMRAQLRGVEAVLGDGSVVSHLGGLEKDNTGYDLAGLLCGSEGTLGLVTAARVRLLPAPVETTVALLGFADFDAAVAAAVTIRDQVAGLEVAEVFLDSGLDLVCRHLGTGHPFTNRPAAYLLVEATGRHDTGPELARAVDGTAAVEVAVAGDGPRRAALWRFREAHSEAIASLGVVHKLDVTLPVRALAEFVEAVGPAVTAAVPTARCWLFGHVLDGNLHVNVSGVDPADDRVDDLVLGMVADRGGSISAEHGIGRAKVPWLHLVRSPAEVAAMRAVKAALDPSGILNPGVLLPPA